MLFRVFLFRYFFPASFALLYFVFDYVCFLHHRYCGWVAARNRSSVIYFFLFVFYLFCGSSFMSISSTCGTPWSSWRGFCLVCCVRAFYLHRLWNLSLVQVCRSAYSILLAIHCFVPGLLPDISRDCRQLCSHLVDLLRLRCARCFLCRSLGPPFIALVSSICLRGFKRLCLF